MITPLFVRPQAKKFIVGWESKQTTWELVIICDATGM